MQSKSLLMAILYVLLYICQAVLTVAHPSSALIRQAQSTAPSSSPTPSALASTETFAVCDHDFALKTVENFLKCEECLEAIQNAHNFGEPLSKKCSPGCCAKYDLQPAIGHFMTCYNGCCYRLISLQLYPGIPEDQADFVIRTQTIVNNGMTYVNSTGIGHCGLVDGPKEGCGPRCADQFQDRTQCAGRRTAQVPVFGAFIHLPPCSYPDRVGSGRAVCFPADASVFLEDGSFKRMDRLKVGDRVLVSPGIYSEVFSFTHQDPSVAHKFLELNTSSGHTLTLTSGHYLYANGALCTAENVVVGDRVSLGKGGFATVTSVAERLTTGLYNPQTLHGDIVVNGVISSTYTEFLYSSAAHALLAPVRAVSAVVNVADWIQQLANIFHGKSTVAIKVATVMEPNTACLNVL